MSKLIGSEWRKYLKENGLKNKKQEEIYVCTWKYNAIYKLGDYYFCSAITRGYKNITSLKRLISIWA